MSTFSKYFTPIASTIGFLALSNLISVDAAGAVSTTLTNGGFESNYSGWTTTGDTTVQQAFQGINAPTGSNHALITTACPSTAFASGECFDTRSTSTPRNDDSPTPAGTFNKSGNDQISASINTPDLQTFLGLSPNALSIPRAGGQISGTRTAKEGSAIKQQFTVTKGGQLQLNFKWDYLTNDGGNSILGDQDFAFWTFYRTDSDPNTRIINTLASTTGSAPALTSSSTAYGNVGGYKTSSFFDAVTPGNYVLGFGVVDVDGTDGSSALLVDDVKAIPFELSPSLGLGIAIGMFGLDHLRRNLKNKSIQP